MATGAPGSNGVWLYGEDDNEATFSALLNKAGTTVNTQLGLDRNRLTTLEARPISGLIPVIPSSITIATGSGSINALGVVTYTGATSLSLSGIFTSTYNRYYITYQFRATGNGEFRYRLRQGATDSAAAYQEAGWRVFQGGGSGSFSGTNMAQASMGDIINASAEYQSGRLELSNPNVATFTTGQAHHTGYASGGGVEMVLHSVNHEAAGVYDGITFFPSAGNVSGTIQVFGYND